VKNLLTLTETLIILPHQACSAESLNTDYLVDTVICAP
jgi:hypothetical protein